MKRTRPYCLAGFALMFSAIYPVTVLADNMIEVVDTSMYSDNQDYAGPLRLANDHVISIDVVDQDHYLQYPYLLAQNTAGSKLQELVVVQDNFFNEAKVAYEAAYGLVLDEDWKNAASSLSNYSEKYTDSPWYDDARFWLCYSEDKGGLKKPAEAFECYQTFVDTFPTSNWADDARTNMIRLARVIEQSGDTSYRAIVQNMQADEEEKLVLTAIAALQSAGDDDTVEALAEAYDNSDNQAVRERIVYVLSNSQTRQAADKLMDIARHDRSDDIRSLAVQSLGRKIRGTITIGWDWGSSANTLRFESATRNASTSGGTVEDIDTEEIARTLKDIAIEDKSSTVRNAAFAALAGAPADIALEFIIDTATSGDDYTIRRMAVEALGRSDDPRAREALLDIISSQK